MHYYQESLRIRSAINDKKGVSTVLNNIGIVYLDWGLAEEAFIRHQEALNIAREIDDVYAIAYSNTNLGNYYNSLKQYHEAIHHYKLGYATVIKKGINQTSYSFLLANIGRGFREMGRLDSALYYFQSSLHQAFLINNKYWIASAEYNLGKTYLMMNSLDSARKHILRCFRTSFEENYTSLFINNQIALAELEEESGNFRSAYYNYKEASVLKDSIFNQDKLLKFNELQIQINLKQEEAKNTLLRKNIEIQELAIHKQKIFRIILFGSILLILVILVVIAKSRNTYMDLTKRLQKTEKELRDSNSSKDRFISIISHDLRNPILSLLGISEILESKYDTLSTEKIKDFIKLQYDTSINANKLLEDLLEWAKAHTGKVEYLEETLDVYEITEENTYHFGLMAQEKRISIENKVQENSFIKADRKATDTLIRNILTNAIKFTEPGGKISIEAEKIGEEMRISISDTGIGMSDELVNHLFRLDYHHTSLGTDKESGTGLGLILCKELVEKQGGRIWVESQVGKGSKFIFTLPLPK